MVEIITCIVLTLTLVAIIWYAWETREMQKGIKKQIALSVKPCLAFNFGKNGSSLVTRNITEGECFSLVNIGNASAVNIKIKKYYCK